MSNVYLSSRVDVIHLLYSCNLFNYFYVIEGNVPYYNIELIAENKYCISIMVVGFLKHELEVIIYRNVLIIVGNSNILMRNYLYHGIVKRNFKYKIILLENIQVMRVNLESGLLNIYLNLKCVFKTNDNVSVSKKSCDGIIKIS